jgi:hypothetical protein
MIPIKEYFAGNRYNFQVQVEKLKSDFLFEINSQHIESKCKSTITNLNFLISELIHPVLDIIVEENSLSLTKMQSEKLFKKASICFRNKSWIRALEESLDHDRNESEWNANFTF